MKIKITPDEWKVQTRKETEHKTLHIYSEGKGAICEIPNRYAALEEHEANAKLITAAPDLLDALLSMRIILQGYKRLDKETIGYKAQEKAFKAIDKALK